MATHAASLQPVATVKVRLQSLLSRAREIKPGTAVEPPLPTSDLISEVEALHHGFEESYDYTYKSTVVETAARDLFYSLVTSNGIGDPDFANVWNLLDIVLICGDHDKCIPEVVCYLIEELLDSQTTEGCRTVFDYLDSRRERLTRKDFHKKNLVFLRSCNELLRRLSRAEDAIFCGRVFFFLFQTFPLGDKSSVNLRGEFHTENITKFEVSEPKEGNDETGSMEVDAKEEESSTKQVGTPLPSNSGRAGGKSAPKAATKSSVEEQILSNSDLYPVFWGLQHDFSDPNRLFDDQNFTSFKTGLANTINKFKKTPTVVQTLAGEDDKHSRKRKLSDGATQDSNDHVVDNYNPKYLTSRDLFDLELSDLAFQRHILVQSLILIDFLLSLTEKAKKRLAELSTSNKSMLYAFILNEEDTKWAVSTRLMITQYLGSTSEGRQYCRMVETVLARDKNWVRWKVESCPSIVRGPVSTKEELEVRKGAADATRPRKIPARPNNAMDLTFLDERGGDGGLEALRAQSRYAAPSVEQLLEKVKTDKLDLEMAFEEEEKTSLENSVQNATWRALRQARSSKLALLDKMQSGKDLEEMMKGLERAEAEPSEQNGEEAGGPAITVSAEESAAVGAEPQLTGVEESTGSNKEAQ